MLLGIFNGALRLREELRFVYHSGEKRESPNAIMEQPHHEKNLLGRDRLRTTNESLASQRVGRKGWREQIHIRSNQSSEAGSLQHKIPVITIAEDGKKVVYQYSRAHSLRKSTRPSLETDISETDNDIEATLRDSESLVTTDDISPKIQPSVPHYEAEAEAIIEDVTSIHRELSDLECLRPGDEVNCLFGKLVGICTKTLPMAVTEKIMADLRITSIVADLRALASTGECFLEEHWAESVVFRGGSHEQVFTSLKNFPYYQNYVDLAKMELATLLPLLPSSPRNIAFIGSGPLPLTSLCISHLLAPFNNSSSSASLFSTTSTHHKENTPPPTPPLPLRILNIDNNPDAISQSSELCKRLGKHGQGMEFSLEEAGREEADGEGDLSGFDVVFLAALVGTSQFDKEEVLRKVVARMRGGALVVIRTSHGLRRLLYPEFDYTTPSILSYLEILNVVHPYSHIVNSIIVARVR